MTTRCKVLCTKVSKVDGKGWYTEPKQEFIYEAFFTAVSGASPENKAFFASTPTLTLEIRCINGDRFQAGQEYYLDISAADTPSPTAA